MLTYYALIAWVVVTATWWYGAGPSYWGRTGWSACCVPSVLGLLTVTGTRRRSVAERLSSVHQPIVWSSGVVMAGLGVFLITLFGGFPGSSLL